MFTVKIQRDSLLKPLLSVAGIVERRHTLPILSNVLIENKGGRFCFMATDLEIQITAYAEFLEPQEDFEVTVSAKKLLDICRALPDDAQLALEGQDSRMQLKAGKSRFNLQTLPAEDFPKMNLPAQPPAHLKIAQKTLKHLLGSVQYAMAQQDIRYYLNGLLLVCDATGIKVVATDGHRLSLAARPMEEPPAPGEIILPRKTVIELTKLLTDSDEEVNIEIAQNQVKFSFGNIVLISKVVDGKFPDYTKVIPLSFQKQFDIERVTLLQALQRTAILSNEKFRGVRLVLTQDSLRIICNNSEQEEAQEELEIQYQGEPLDIGFNVTYLLDVLNNMSAPVVRCNFNDANSSGLLSVPDDDNFKYVVMPMRI